MNIKNILIILEEEKDIDIYRSRSRNIDRNKNRALNKEDLIFVFRNDKYKEIMEMNEDEKEDEENGIIF